MEHDSDVFGASKLSLISVSVFPSKGACFNIDLNATPAVTLHHLSGFFLAAAEQHSLVFTPVPFPYIRSSTFGQLISGDCSVTENDGRTLIKKET